MKTKEIFFSTIKRLFSTKKIAVLMRKIEQLEEKNRELNMMAEGARYTVNGVIIVNAEGEIEWVNPGFTNMTGYTLEGLKKARGSTIFEASYSRDIISIFNRVIMFKMPVTYDTFMFTKYYRKVCVSSLITPIFDKKGQLERMVIIDTDISKYQRKQDEMSDNIMMCAPAFKKEVNLTRK